MSALSERREQKLQMYGKPIPGLRVYMNFFTPAIAILATWGFIAQIVSWSGNMVSFISQALYALLAVCTAITIRDVDLTSLRFAVALQVVMFIQSVIGFVSAFIGAAHLTGAVGSAAGNVGGVAGAIVASGANLGLGIVVLSETVTFILIATFSVYYLVVFIKNKNFFKKGIKDLKKELLK